MPVRTGTKTILGPSKMEAPPNARANVVIYKEAYNPSRSLHVQKLDVVRLKKTGFRKCKDKFSPQLGQEVKMLCFSHASIPHPGNSSAHRRRYDYLCHGITSEKGRVDVPLSWIDRVIRRESEVSAQDKTIRDGIVTEVYGEPKSCAPEPVKPEHLPPGPRHLRPKRKKKQPANSAGRKLPSTRPHKRARAKPGISESAFR